MIRHIELKRELMDLVLKKVSWLVNLYISFVNVENLNYKELMQKCF